MNESGIVLYMIPTIVAEGTDQDVISPQIKDIISNLNVFFVENIRTSRRFISSLKLGRIIDEMIFIELNKDTPESVTAEELKKLRQNAGVISEAGCPGVADPGAVAVNIAHQLGIRVVPLVGPSSLLLALMASGMSGQSFAFHGYLPIDKAQRKTKIQMLEREARQRQQTQLFMETPFRNNQLLEALLENCMQDTLLCVACNVTAEDEFIKTKTIKSWKAELPDLHKKPTIFLIG
ncbi:SAM-dependent methyltransferase [Dyadobacter arcticus]|uniref:16S rRNA (Cytidine1402-2'-O)-methyltransferase n=1 Tax=Dyadobacter arcticus TaxID=1078754 RepID=A0ABX0UGA4_9BACT|nr:SAM-dependent methyltransferase [Dyadobacter arcticus]NIJ52038.1 16S rRNA (cytidine1402-2'-O)-methyltransferase [Dyadobacter arcticus]